jgi:hypothetical protein
LRLTRDVPVTFSYDANAARLEVVVHPAPNQTWRLSIAPDAGAQTLQLDVENGDLTLLAGLLPADLPALTHGTVTGRVKARDVFGGTVHATGTLRLSDVQFGDEAGLRAGEKVGGEVVLELDGPRERRTWRADLRWETGEVFWQPIYLRGGHRLTLQGSLTPEFLVVTQGKLDLAQVGSLGFALRYSLSGGKIEDATVDSSELDLGGLYAVLLQPSLAGTVGSELRVEGAARISASLRSGALEQVRLQLLRVSVEDTHRRFAIFGLDADIPWQREGVGPARVGVKGGEILRIPLGKVDASLQVRADGVSAKKLEIPVLDGVLALANLDVQSDGRGWTGRVEGELKAVSLSPLSVSLGLPAMQGTLSGRIPRLQFDGTTLSVDGAFLLEVFDGTVKISDVSIVEPFGRAARMRAGIDMRNLDLDLITRTFSFGNMTGRIDAQVTGLELVSWRPVRFDARLTNSPGKYQRRISQRAVQNISSLGGPGAAAAIERSFLRFFDEFGYVRLGLSCRFRNDVCEMGGLEDRASGYLIVEGGGIPSITVMGYNRNVSGSELVARLMRITQGNPRPIVK